MTLPDPMSPVTPIKRGTLTYTARFVMHFVTSCRSLSEAHESLPDLTSEQFEAIKAGRAYLTGDTQVGLEYVEH